MNAYFTSMLVGLAFLWGPVCSADQAKTPSLKSVSGASKRGQLPARCETSDRAIRWIEDPSTHLHWILLRNPCHSAGPAMLAPVQSNSVRSLRGGEDRGAVEAIYWPPALVPVIHGGEKLIVEEHSNAADVRLEGTALGPAAIGETLRVRLEKSGKILSVIAAGPGRATMLGGRREVRW